MPPLFRQIFAFAPDPGMVLGIAGAGGGFAATRMGLFSGGGDAPAQKRHTRRRTIMQYPPKRHLQRTIRMLQLMNMPRPLRTPATDDGHGAASATGNFVALDPLVVNIQDQAGGRFLRFVAEIEAEPGHAAEVEAIRPRFADVLNGYLRAVDLADLQNPQGLDLLRGQMLRRLQTVAGEGVIRDLLITEFVLN